MSEAVIEEKTAKPAKEAAKKVAVPSVLGMMVYTDGGARPNPGFCGYGIHGYVYDTAISVKGIGRGNEVATNVGYQAKIQKNGKALPTLEEKNVKEEDEVLTKLSDSVFNVMPVHYIDSYGTVPGENGSPFNTNNAAEAVALGRALSYALEHNVKHVQVLTDSKYAMEGANEWVHGWERNGWVKNDGMPVKNADTWKFLKQTLDALRMNGATIKIDWTRGHDGETGNEAADKLATMGVFQASLGNEIASTITTPAQGYWKHDPEKHPFIADKRLYFNTAPGACVPGVYYMGGHGKDDELFGKRQSSANYSIVRLETPEPLIEDIRNAQAKVSNFSDALFEIYLDKVYTPQVYKLLKTHKDASFEPPTGLRLDLTHVTKAPITREFTPARLAWRAAEELVGLNGVLDDFLNSNPRITSTEITDVLYNITQKVVKGKKGESDKVETEVALKPELAVGLSVLKVDINHPFGGEKKVELSLAVGIDILDRNSLKRLETHNPKVHVVTWQEGEGVYRYATVVKIDGGVGIWAGQSSNLRLLT